MQTYAILTQAADSAGRLRPVPPACASPHSTALWPCSLAFLHTSKQSHSHRLQIQQVASGLCLSSLNGEASLVYQEQCKTATAGGGPLPWQLWQLEAVEPAAAGAAVQPFVRGGGGVYRIRSLAGGWCMQVRPGVLCCSAEELQPYNACKQSSCEGYHAAACHPLLAC